MANSPLPGQHGELVTPDRRPTSWWYDWFRKVNTRLLATETVAQAASDAVAATEAVHVPDVQGVPGEVIVTGSVDTSWRIGLDPSAVSNGGTTIVVQEEHYHEEWPVVPQQSASAGGSGDVVGPASSTADALALFDGTTGKLLKDSAVTIDTDDTLAADSDSRIPTQQAVKAYVDTEIAGVGGGGIASGTSNPGSPSNNDLFYRTDLDKLIFYNGSIWLTVAEFPLPALQFDALPPYSSTRTGPIRWNIPTGANLFLTRLACTFYVLTTSSGTQYWTLNLYQYTAAEAQIGSSLGTASTVSQAANQYIRQTDIALNVALDSTARVVYPVLTKVSTPGNLYPTMQLWAREIIT